MRNIFLEKLYTKYGDETIPRLSFKNSKLSVSLDQQSKVLDSLFLLYIQVEGYHNILKLRCRPRAFTPYKAFVEKQKEVWN